MRVAVIGGGVVGLCTALELTQAGADVVVLDRGTGGGTASLPNAGWVVPALSAPLSGPGVVTDTLRQLIRDEAAFAVRPALSLDLARWVWHFVRSGTAHGHREGLRSILELGAHSVDLFARLHEDGVSFEMHRTGLLLAARRDEGLHHAASLVHAAEQVGYRGTFEMVTGAALTSREPALAPTLAGGIHARDEGHVRPDTLLQGLTDVLTKRGALVRTGCEVRRLDETSAGRWRVVTASPAADIHADRVVIAAGIWSATLLRGLGVDVPMLPAKGYSLTSTGTGKAPRHALKLVEANIACTPFADGVRLAGTFELGGRGERVPRRRIDRVVRLATRYLRDWRPGNAAQWSAGLRPATPDSLPLIGGVPGCPGVFTATGHGMLGVTLAPATAEAVAPMVLTGCRPAVLHPFRLERFSRSKSSPGRS